jgi:hypothetical protein
MKLVFLAAIMIVPAYSQTATVVSGAYVGGIGFGSAGMGISNHGNNTETTFTYNFPRDLTVFVVSGAPYAGRTVSQSVRTLANGTHLTQPAFEQPMTYRDSMGRTRTESRMQPLPPMGAVAKAPPQIASLPEIEDPVAGYRIILDPVHQIAHRIPIQVRQNQAPNINTAIAAPRIVTPLARPHQDGATVEAENLGTQTIFGVPATGHRTTTTYPVGTYQGNDQPVIMVNETWNSVQYGMVLKSSNTGPESDSTMIMKDFSGAEPDPSLFMIPAGYQIVDETGEFTITIPRNQ